MSRSVRESLNAANPNNLADGLRLVRGGDALAQTVMSYRGTTDANDKLELPEAAKAAHIIAAFVTSGGGAGYKAPALPESTPGVGEVVRDVVGDVQFTTGEATSVEVEVIYAPMPGPIYEDLVDVAGSAATLLQSRQGVIMLEAEVTDGLVNGSKTVIARGGTPAAGEAALTNAGTGVAFNATDIVAGTARVKYIAAEIEDVTRRPLVERLNDQQSAV